MDIKTALINKIECQLIDKFSQEQIKDISNTIYIQLNNYDIKERSTELTQTKEFNSPIHILKNFIASKRMAGLSEKTLQRYYELCYKLLIDLNKSLEQITTYDLRFYLSNYKQIRDISNRTLDGMRMCYASFFNWCYENEIIRKNPCLGLEAIKYEKKINLPYSDSEMEQIRRACKTTRDRALVEFLYATGCRVSEVAALNRSDVDFANNSVLVLGKGAKERTVYLEDVAVLYLKEYLSSRTDSNICLFYGKRGRLSKAGIECRLHVIGDQAGIKDVHPHRFRRTLATNLMNKGASIQYVATILGHADITTTQVYCYINQENVAQTYRKYM